MRDDIIAQLRLRDPLTLVGRFDRPNLTYRILPQVDRQQQVIEVLRRHKGEAAIVYCLSRRDTESLAQALRCAEISAEHYHAGMAANERRATQERFAAEQTDVIVATIAFGMGVDRSNVRAVIHACLPKSVENYQQETGRAGRDGLPSECVLFYSQGDVIRLERLIRKGAEDAPDSEAATANVEVQMQLLKRMQRFASTAVCRHRLLSEYFGQSYDKDKCDTCDVCLGEVEGIEDSTVVAQKILSCVARVEERFGIGHVVDVLAGAKTERICQLGHDTLSTHGLLHDTPRKTLQSYVYQLLEQEVLARSDGEYPVLQLNEASWQVMRGQRKVILVRPKASSRKGRDRSRAGALSGEDMSDPWVGVDHGLFEHLRQMRRQIAGEQGVPPFVVLHDRTLLDLARVRPTNQDVLLSIHGVGQRKREVYGDRIIEAVTELLPSARIADGRNRVGPVQPGPRRRLNPQDSNTFATTCNRHKDGPAQKEPGNQDACTSGCPVSRGYKSVCKAYAGHPFLGGAATHARARPRFLARYKNLSARAIRVAGDGCDSASVEAAPRLALNDTVPCEQTTEARRNSPEIA